MKRFFNIFVFTFLIFVIIFLYGCEDSKSDDNKDYTKLETVYQLATDQGFKSSYKDWIKQLKGDTGKDGLTPFIKNGNWWIGEKNTGVRAAGEDGWSTYRIYLYAHPEYTKSSKEWIEDLINGELVTYTHTVKFNTECDIEIEDQTVKHGNTVTKPNEIAREGYTFEG